MPLRIPGRLQLALLCSPILALCLTILLAATTFAVTGGADWPR
jgi:hypothetical protein